MSLLLRGGLLVDLDPPGVERADLRVVGDRIAERAPCLAPLAGDEVVELEGDLLLPGLVNAHHHLYSALACGMPGPVPEGFEEALRRVWWPLDQALDHDDIAHGARVGLVEAARCGTTTILDHHASPSCIEGSLDVLADAFASVGLRGVLAYEVTDRHGPEGARRGLAECQRAMARHGGGRLAAIIGLHASFTLEDATLRAAAGLGGPVHVHLAEGRVDVADARRRGHPGPAERLERFGLLEGAVAAHGVHLDDASARRLADAGATLVHNPTSNRNNRVGYARPGRFVEVALGTDGIGSDPFRAARDAFFAAREHRHALDLLAAVRGGHRLASRLLGVPLGRLVPPHAADLVRLEAGPTPLAPEQLAGHLAFGWSARAVRDVWVGGRRIVAEGRVITVDARRVYGAARERAADLWRRVARRRGEAAC